MGYIRRTQPATAVLIAFLGACSALAQESELWPGTAYDPSIPTIFEVVGHEPGTEITPHRGLVEYFEALSSAIPDRVRLVDYGKTWEGRRLVYAIIAKPDTLARIDAVQEEIGRLADPRTTDEKEAENLIRSLPATVWLSYGVHGNEISSSDAALATAYHLLAATNSEVVDAIRENAVVVVGFTADPNTRAYMDGLNVLFLNAVFRGPAHARPPVLD